MYLIALIIITVVILFVKRETFFSDEKTAVPHKPYDPLVDDGPQELLTGVFDMMFHTQQPDTLLSSESTYSDVYPHLTNAYRNMKNTPQVSGLFQSLKNMF